MTQEKAKTYEVKDLDGEKYTIKANGYTVSGNGLIFTMNDIKVAWFIRWSNYRVL